MLMPSPPPSLDKDAPSWSDDIGASPLDIRQRIFCNRSLNMASIRVSSQAILTEREKSLAHKWGGACLCRGQGGVLLPGIYIDFPMKHDKRKFS